MSRSAFLQWTRPQDLESLSAALMNEQTPSLPYLHVELRRVRPGMADFITSVSTSGNGDKKATTVTMRCNRRQSSYKGAKALANVIVREMTTRGDTSIDWTTVDRERLTKMLAAELKFFANSQLTELLQFTTEAL